MQLRNRVDTQPVKRFKRLKGYLECGKYGRIWDFTSQLVWWHYAFAHL